MSPACSAASRFGTTPSKARGYAARAMRVATIAFLAACCPPLPATTTPPKVTTTDPGPPDEGPPQPDPTPPELRLPATVKPLRNEVVLTLDPATEDFTGTIAIDLELTEPTSVVWLNQEEITI